MKLVRLFLNIFYNTNIAVLGLQPRQIITLLKQRSDISFLSSNIYNAIAKIRRTKLKGLSMSDALFADLDARKIPYQTQPDEDGRTRYLFIAHPDSLKLAMVNQDVVLADCTYSTNKYNMPLLHLVGK